MSAQLVSDASVTVPLVNNRMDEAAMLADPAIVFVLTSALTHLVRSHNPVSQQQNFEL